MKFSTKILLTLIIVVSAYLGGFMNGKTMQLSKPATYSQCQISSLLQKGNSDEVTSNIPLGVLNETSSLNLLTRELEWQHLFDDNARYLFVYVNPYTDRQFVLLVDDEFRVKDSLVCESIFDIEYPIEGIGTHLAKLLTNDHAVVVYPEKIKLESKRKIYKNLKRKLDDAEKEGQTKSFD